MSYVAEVLMKQNMSPEEYRANVGGPAAAPDPILEAPRLMAEAAPAAAAPGFTLSAQRDANITAQRMRFPGSGYSEEAASRLLGGSRQNLGG